MNKTTYLLFFICLIICCKKRDATELEKPKVIEVPKAVTPVFLFGYNINNYNVVDDTIKKGESFGLILDRYNVLYPKINKIATSVKKTFDVRKVQTGKPYTLLTSKDSLQQAQVFIYKHNKIQATVIDFKDSVILAQKHIEKIKLVEKETVGQINANLSTAMDSLGFQHSLINAVEDIYATTLDFYRLQKGDIFKLIYEEKYINDTLFVGYGKIKAALFKHKGEELYAYRFIADTLKGIAEYYDEKANLMRSTFLKSPIKFQYRISSRFNLRRRIKYYKYRVRPHRGTDFAAPYGTPIMTTASGTVVESARKGGNGNYVKVKHNSKYSTQYLHMKRRKVKVGDYVEQGDVIGWVGMTGNTSGPHVCYRFWKNGVQVDPLHQKLPPAKPLNDSLKPSYFKYIKPLKEQLDNIYYSEKTDSIFYKHPDLATN
ncbi:MAG: peptidoglycan DD-metalloendopeptidase family protein [Tenacibaculum sp.]